MESTKEKLINEYKLKLKKILDAEFPKGLCGERGESLVLFSYAIIYLKEALEELDKEKIMAINSKVLNEFNKGVKPALENIREKLADLEHQRWSNWQRYLHSICIKESNGDLTIPAKSVKHWERQIATNYKDLTEKEKDSDRKEVDKVIKLFIESL